MDSRTNDNIPSESKNNCAEHRSVNIDKKKKKIYFDKRAKVVKKKKLFLDARERKREKECRPWADKRNAEPDAANARNMHPVVFA